MMQFLMLQYKHGKKARSFTSWVTAVLLYDYTVVGNNSISVLKIKHYLAVGPHELSEQSV